jgi:tetratricopeptide (TPR) repeat protein
MRRVWIAGGLAAAGLGLIVTVPTVAAAQPAECAEARAAVPRLLGEMPPPGGAEADETLVSAAKRGLSRADGYSALAAASMLRGDVTVAASASLQALTLEWNARHAANLGVALMYLVRYDEAAGLLTCARELDPELVFAIEAQALLAHRRKNCPDATRLIGEAATRMPGDANVHYSAGIIHFKCGNQAGAASELRTAVDIAPVDAVMAQALAAVAPGPPPSSPTPKAVRKQIDELFRFMDQTVATADRDGRLMKRIRAAQGEPPDVAFELLLAQLKQAVATRKKLMTTFETSTAPLAKMVGPGVWNGVLEQCINMYLQTTSALQFTEQMGQPRAILMAAALGQEPVALASRAMSNAQGYVNQGEERKYWAVVIANTNVGPTGVNCPPILDAYRVYTERVGANLDALQDGFPRAAAAYANRWLSYAEQDADYARRTAAVMRFAATEKAVAAAWTGRLQSEYRSIVGAMLGNVKDLLKKTQDLAAEDVKVAGHTMVAERVTTCYVDPPEGVSLADAVERLMEALNKAGTYDADLSTPDCTIGIGPVKLSCKPFAFEGVKATWSGGPVKVTATAGDRWGVDASVSAGPLSASSKGSRMNVASTKAEANFYGVEGEVGVSSWIEQNSSGQTNAFVEVKGTLGVGVDAEGLGTVGCEFFNASAKFNLRAFAETLTR